MGRPLVIGAPLAPGSSAAVVVRSLIGDQDDLADQERACREACAGLGLAVGEVRRVRAVEVDGARLAQEVPAGAAALVVRDLGVAFGRDRCALRAQDAHEMRVDDFRAAAPGVRLVIAEVRPGDRETLGRFG
ncbi:MAG: hypothetical protein MUE51_05600, partial [Thermoleophilia bacterium]|jgi:hypothetical protein|nr:hypothetical protein [Thermoleophilia bacterium]